MKGYLNRLPKRGFGEAKKIAEHLRVSSTFISHVLSGAKSLSLEQAMLLGPYFGLSDVEFDYFIHLVEFDRAGSDELKKYFKRKIDDLKKKSLKLVDRIETKRVLSEKEKSIFYSSSLFSMIHIFTATHNDGRSLEDICRRFEISRQKAADIIRFLVESGLCIEHNDRFKIGTQGTHLEQGSSYLLKHHTNWRLRAVAAAENLSEQELMYTVNVALSVKDFNILREEMGDFVKRFLDRVYPSPSEELATLNMDWFWIRK